MQQDQYNNSDPSTFRRVIRSTFPLFFRSPHFEVQSKPSLYGVIIIIISTDVLFCMFPELLVYSYCLILEQREDNE